MPHPDFDRAAKHITSDNLRQSLKEMVDTASPTGEEGEMASLIADRFRTMGLRVSLQEVNPGRPNVVAVLEGEGDGANLLFTGHMDTSYRGDEDYLTEKGYKAKTVYGDGFIWGLGASNMKSGLASMLAAIDAIAKEGIPLKGDITFGAVVGEIEKDQIEEFQGTGYNGYGIGTRHLVTHGVMGDFAILAEPTGLMVSNANLGVIWVKITVRGTVSHSAFTHDPSVVNAVTDLHKVQAAVEEWRRDYMDRNVSQGERPTVLVSAVRGGLPWRLSRNPIEASLYLDIRTIPGQTADQVKRELRALLGRVKGNGGPAAELDFYVNDPPAYIPPNHPVVAAMRRAHAEETGRDHEPILRRPASDSAHTNRYDVPTCVYGPGGQTNDKGTEGGLARDLGENVRVDDLVTASRVYLAAALELCSKPAADLGLK